MPLKNTPSEDIFVFSNFLNQPFLFNTVLEG